MRRTKESIAILFFHGSSAPLTRGSLKVGRLQRGLRGLQTSPVSWLGEKKNSEAGLALESGNKENTFLQGLKTIHAGALYAGAKAPALLKKRLFPATFKTQRPTTQKSSLAAFP